jgi:hypothetical protein
MDYYVAGPVPCWQARNKLGVTRARRRGRGGRRFRPRRTIDEVTAEMLALKIDELERIDRMVAGAEARRNVALREIDRHRATLGAALRQEADEVLDAEFKEVPPRLTEGEAV